MPIYEFSCHKCGRVFDLLVMGGEDVDMKCPDCGGRDIVKLMSAVSHSFGMSNYKCRGGPGGVKTNQCGSDSCVTMDIPGREN